MDGLNGKMAWEWILSDGVLADIGRVLGSEGEGYCVKTLNINVNNRYIIVNII